MNTSKIGVTGADSKLGRELLLRGCVPIDVPVTNYEDLYNSISNAEVDFVIHCAEIGDIQYCENKANQAEVIAVNAKGTFNVVNVCTRLKIKMIYISTNYVFDGKKWFGSYKETDEPKPITFYGMTKLGGEAVCMFADDKIKVVRTTEYIRPNHLADGLLYFLENFDRMPKLLNISVEQFGWKRLENGGLNVSLAKRLGIPLYSVTPDYSWPSEDIQA